jgi:hypothetical protein
MSVPVPLDDHLPEVILDFKDGRLAAWSFSARRTASSRTFSASPSPPRTFTNTRGTTGCCSTSPRSPPDRRAISLLEDGDPPKLGQKVLPGLASPSRMQLSYADQKTAKVADETCGLLRRRDAQVVQEDIQSFAVGSTDGAGERECVEDARGHRRYGRATTPGSAELKNGHSHPENRHGPSCAWMNSACWHHKHWLVLLGSGSFP